MEDIVSSVPNFCGNSDCPVGVHIKHCWVYDGGTYSVCDSDGNHDGWCEAGLVTAAYGRLVCLEAPLDVREEFMECEPIRPPLTVHRPID